jgi:hypothetical protein
MHQKSRYLAQAFPFAPLPPLPLPLGLPAAIRYCLL